MCFHLEQNKSSDNKQANKQTKCEQLAKKEVSKGLSWMFSGLRKLIQTRFGKKREPIGKDWFVLKETWRSCREYESASDSQAVRPM